MYPRSLGKFFLRIESVKDIRFDPLSLYFPIPLPLFNYSLKKPVSNGKFFFFFDILNNMVMRKDLDDLGLPFSITPIVDSVYIPEFAKRCINSG